MESNLHIVQRLLELAKNQIEYNVYPKHYKEEHIFLSNMLSDSLRKHEDEFARKFQEAVGQYKGSLRDKTYGWFHSPEKLVWLNMEINQLKYAIYGERFVHELNFNEDLGNDAYRDFICQINRTVLMTPEELKIHNDEVNKLSMEILQEILAEEKERTK